jgi:hypothetical protein
LNHVHLRIGSRFDPTTNIVPEIVQWRCLEVAQLTLEREPGAFNRDPLSAEHSVHTDGIRTPSTGSGTVLSTLKFDWEQRGANSRYATSSLAGRMVPSLPE